MENIDLSQAQQCLSELIDQVLSGDEIIITKEGQPIAKLVSITKPKKQRQFGSAKGLIKMSADFNEPLEDFKEYM